MTGLLIFTGTVFFLVVEYDNTAQRLLAGLPASLAAAAGRLVPVITPRTAGFNSIDQTTLTDSSKLMTIILMFIGAAPGSTGGGIKISTFAVILATIFSDVRGRDDIVLFRHRLRARPLPAHWPSWAWPVDRAFCNHGHDFHRERAALDAGRIRVSGSAV